MVLKDLVSADSGVYTVREVNDGVALIRTVLVTVKRVVQPCDAVLTELTVVLSATVVCVVFALIKVCRNNRTGPDNEL
ncbi:hypothetical protein AOLI_G00098140 [Acnodon oligacanthus]